MQVNLSGGGIYQPAGAAANPALAGLPWRLQRLFTFTVDLYRPQKNAPEPDAGDIEAQDNATQIVPAYKGVPAWYEPTPEALEPMPEGLTRNVNFLTLDKWHFLSSQEIYDGWIVVMRTSQPAGHPYTGRPWLTQGNGTMIAPAPGRPADSQWVYCKISPNVIIPGD